MDTLITEIVPLIDIHSLKETLQKRGCSMPINSGAYGSVLKACAQRSGTCSNICVALKTAANENTEASKIKRDVLINESKMLYTIWSEAESQRDHETTEHVIRFFASVASAENPWLVLEYIKSPTIASMIKARKTLTSSIAGGLMLQTLFTIYNIRKLVPEFVHGDLNEGNIFILERPSNHKVCTFTLTTFTEDGDSVSDDVHFRGLHIVRILDFGLSESKNQTFQNFPAGSNGLRNRWSIDALMAADAFRSVCRDTTDIDAFFVSYFGPFALAYFEDKTADIYRMAPEMPSDMGPFLKAAIEYFL